MDLLPPPEAFADVFYLSSSLPRHEVLPSGRSVMRQFDGAGNLTSEMHAYGVVDIAITIYFTNGTRTEETYIVRKRLASRARYERERLRFPDMPASNSSLSDVGAELNRDIAREKRQRRALKRNRTADPDAARKLDDFCHSMLVNGQAVDARKWIDEPGATLGELSRRSSKALVSSLTKAGAREVFACSVCDNGSGKNTGHLVIELPDCEVERSAVLRIVNRRVQAQGFDPTDDDGQRYVYLKLD